MDLDRRSKISKSETNDFIMNDTASSRNFLLLWAPPASRVPRVQSCFTHSRSAVHMKNHGCRESKSFLMGVRKPVFVLLPREREIISITLSSKVACSLLQKEVLTVLSKAVPYPNSLETAQNKGHWCLCWQGMQKQERPMESCIPTSSQQAR